jgi:hypothetical protein
VSARDEQIRKALEQDERERELRVTRDEMLTALYSSVWDDVKAAYARLEPICLELIARRVRRVLPDATSIPIMPTDQGGPGWVLAFSAPDELNDDDELSVLLRDYGEFHSSEDHPDHDLQLPAKES